MSVDPNAANSSATDVDPNTIPSEYMQDALPPHINEMEVIRDEIAKKEPFVSEPKPLSDLLQKFSQQKNFARQIQQLIDNGTHQSYRQLRADGNCFYRAFLLGLFESLENNNAQLLKNVTKQVSTSCQRLVQFGYEQFTIEDFFEVFMEELGIIQEKLNADNDDYKATDGNGDTPVDRLSNQSHSNYLIFWSRMLTALYMLENEEHFSQFVQGKSFRQFVKADVEAVNAEADHPQFVALIKAIVVPVRVYCLENIENGGPQIVTIPENSEPLFDLLYRPGHYDILYRA